MVENKRSYVRHNKINITLNFFDWVIVENIIPRNVIIERGAAECNIYILSPSQEMLYLNIIIPHINF